jgi:hypothetical protein
MRPQQIQRKDQEPPRPPPHNSDAEMGVLSSIFNSAGKVIPECVEKINEDCFYIKSHRTIYIEALETWKSHKTVELITFTQRLRDQNILKAVGDVTFITNLATFVPTDAAITYYLDIVHDLYLRRQIIANAERDRDRAYDPGPDADVGAILDAQISDATSLRSLHGRNGSRISFRSPSEILASDRNQHANFFGDRLLGIALSLVIAGIGGIGKSRLLLQLLVAFIIQRAWCSIETHNTKEKKWMLIQTQNAIARLQDDLEPLKKYAGDDWPLVEKNLFIHTLETDRDLMLHLSEEKNVRDLESEIRKHDPIGVAFDPLNDVAIGDLSKDVDMSETCRAIGRVCRAGNPERAIIVATHAITGRVGMMKAFGFEAAGFGRNSKVLQTWARAFINVIPANEDYSVLILTCGKNNNGKMFAPFAVRLNSGTMLYEPEPGFDVQSFREQLENPRKARQNFDPKCVAEIDWPKPELDKSGLAQAIQEETGCSKSTAYRLVDGAVTQGVIRYSKRTRIYAKKPK